MCDLGAEGQPTLRPPLHPAASGTLGTRGRSSVPGRGGGRSGGARSGAVRCGAAMGLRAALGLLLLLAAVRGAAVRGERRRAEVGERCGE